MPWNLRRCQESKQPHFITFSCYHRLPKLQATELRDLVVRCLEQTRRRFRFRVYGYGVMPEHVHLLVSEPERSSLASVVQSIKLAVAKRVPRFTKLPHVCQNQANVGHPDATGGRFWQKRYYDHNVRNYASLVEKLRYIRRNPVKRGLLARPEDWHWSSFRHYAYGERGVVEIESEWTVQQREREANHGLAWAGGVKHWREDELGAPRLPEPGKRGAPRR